MGCSSVLLEGNGDFDPSGLALSYLMADSPATVGNLWAVTDKDVDTVTCKLLSQWLDATRDSTQNKDIRSRISSVSLLDCIPSARQKCKLEYLNGASLVHYGFPVYFQKEKK